MLSWKKIDVPLPKENFVQQVALAGKKICLVRDGESLFAFQNTCPHAGGILSGGWCSHGHLICPIHRYEYNLETGRGAPGQGDYITRYPLEVRNDGVYIGFKQSLWKRFFR